MCRCVADWMSQLGERFVWYLWQKQNLSLFPSQSRWGFIQVVCTIIMGGIALAASDLALFISLRVGRVQMTEVDWILAILGGLIILTTLILGFLGFCVLFYFKNKPNEKSSDEYLEEISEATRKTIPESIHKASTGIVISVDKLREEMGKKRDNTNG